MIKKWIYAYFDPNIFLAFCVLYLVIFILSIVVYKLGFARKLPILKSLVVYLMLAFGCIFMTFLGTGLPIIESLLIATVVLSLARLRRNDQAFNRDPNFNNQVDKKQN